MVAVAVKGMVVLCIQKWAALKDVMPKYKAGPYDFHKRNVRGTGHGSGYGNGSGQGNGFGQGVGGGYITPQYRGVL